MKARHVIFFLLLLLWVRARKQAQTNAPATATTVASGDATLRRDFEERLAMLEQSIMDVRLEVENSPYA